jgi:DNA-binding NarL/FixJ family response regulator
VSTAAEASHGAGAPGSRRADRGRPLRVAIVEPEPLYADLLRLALATKAGVTTTACTDASQALDEALSLQPDVYLIGDPLPVPTSAAALGRHLRALVPGAGIVILASVPRAAILEDLPVRDLHGWCVLLRTSQVPLETLLWFLRAAANGRLLMSVNPAPPGCAPHAAPLRRLSRRQHQVLWLLSEGYTNQGIARRLHISERSVESTMYRVYAALGLSRHTRRFNPRVQAARLAFDNVAPSLPKSDA